MTQLEAVRDVTHQGSWWTLAELKAEMNIRLGVYASEAGISARLRDLRKMGMIVDRQLVKGHRGLYEYRVRAR